MDLVRVLLRLLHLLHNLLQGLRLGLDFLLQRIVLLLALEKVFRYFVLLLLEPLLFPFAVL